MRELLRRTRSQMDAAGETPNSLRQALDDHDKIKGWPDPEAWIEVRCRMAAELAILEGRIFPNSAEFDDR